MALERYQQKRDFKATPEPRGRVARAAKQRLAFVVQKHAASHLHYDFRLELGGVLLSWAIPKGPSLDPADKRLAIHVEDHPLQYGTFEGTIPPKQYGAGTVMVWDRGFWVPDSEPKAAYAKGHLKFELVGEKLNGSWTLIRTHGSKYGDGDKAWLLIKDADQFARRGGDAHIVDVEPDSVASGRSLDEIAADQDRHWNSNRGAAQVKARSVAARAVEKPMRRRETARTAAVTAAGLAGATKAPLPKLVAPQLATLVSAVPPGDDWLHEVKYDGYRMLSRIEAGEVRIYSRNGKEWTRAFPDIVAALKGLAVTSAWLDGEVSVVMPDGRTNFQALQNALDSPDGTKLSYFVFDVLDLDGYDLRGATLLERKRLLRRVIPDGDPRLRYGIEVNGSGDQFIAQACKLGFEGIVSKRTDSRYREGLRSKAWVKVKCGKRQEMVIGGFTDPQRSRHGFGALLLGVYEPGGPLRYSGRVGTGFDTKMLTSLRSTLDALEQQTPSFFNPPRGYEAKGVHWVKPTLVAEVAFTEWTNDGTLRHPSFQGLRKDKEATEVIREVEQDEAQPEKPNVAQVAQGSRASSKAARKPGPKTEAPSVASVALSHPDKLLFPESKLTKLDIANYYATISERILPHLAGRPLSLLRCPDGWKVQCFYHKHADKSVNEAVTRMAVPEGDGTATYMAVDSKTALIALVQWGVAEFHPWGSRAPRLERPDQLILDLDPDDNVAWNDVIAAAKLVRTLLEELNLVSFLKTTGGKGLHVVVPIRATIDWDSAKGFTRGIANLLATTFPDRFIASLSKAKRKDRIFIDYLRNAEGATAIAPYSIRARSNAPVAMPLSWDKLTTDVRFDYFNVANVSSHLSRQKKDPWSEFFSSRQTITKAMIKRLA